MHSSEHGPWVVVYKVDYFVLGTLLSSLVLLNTRVVLLSNPKNFSSQQSIYFICYNPKLGSGYNLGKNLSKSEEYD